MNLIDRYVAEVGKNLPLLKGREDIEKELRSTLEDMIEDRASTTGQLRAGPGLGCGALSLAKA